MNSPLKFKNLILQITDTCPLECAYCCVESGPSRREKMELTDAISYVHQAYEMNRNTVLSFTGGEPFVRYPLMLEIARAAHELGMNHSTITSASWCKSQAFARGKLAELCDAGLRTLNVSYDSFHSPWVSPERVKNCIAAGVDLGLRVYVAGSITKDSQGARDLLGEWPDQFPNVTVADGAVQPTGRAKQIPSDLLLVSDWGEMNLCCPVTSDLLITPDGKAYPCCSTGGDYEYLTLGNAKESSLAELRSRAENSVWYQIITQMGFSALERLVQRYYPDVQFPREHLGVCHLCQLVFGETELASKVRDSVRQLERERSQRAVDVWLDLRAALTSSAP